MWKVRNNINACYLKKFETEIIEPIFAMIQEIVTEIEIGKIILPFQNKGFWKQTTIFQMATSVQQKVLFRIMQKTISGRKLEDLLFDIVISCDSTYVETLHKLYKHQNHEVNTGNYAIQQVTVGDYYKELFVDFYYSNFFADEEIWINIVGEKFNRGLFHKHFRSENNKLAVCPYCDMDTIVAISNISIEHFLPKSKFPLLAMNPLNLISSCTACNKAQEGKGDRVSDPPIVTPYNAMLGNYADFSLDFLKKKITLINSGGQSHDNYFKLLKLYSRYSEAFIFECVDDSAKSLFYTLSQYSNPTKEAINLYIANTKEGKEKLSFVLKSAITKYPEYRNFR